MNEISQLLRGVIQTITHHKELIRARGESFNIFSVLELENREAVHSKFLKELLDPKGSHGLGNVFLELFVEQIGLKEFSIAKARVELEDHLGPKTPQTGGRIDISIFGDHRKLLIENKIWASDQENQVIRYLNSRASTVVYLTREGTEPDCFQEIEEASRTRLRCISYKEDILAWLQKCQTVAISSPMLRETIGQYIIMVRQLTGQNPDKPMENEIVERVLADESTLAAHFALLGVKDAVIESLWGSLVKELERAAEKRGMSFSLNHHDDQRPRKWSEQYAGFNFASPAIWDQFNVSISFQFEKGNNQGLGFGFGRDGNGREALRGSEKWSALREKFSNEFGGSVDDNPYWLAHAGWEGWQSWNWETLLQLKTGQFLKAVETKLDELHAILEQLNSTVAG